MVEHARGVSAIPVKQLLQHADHIGAQVAEQFISYLFGGSLSYACSVEYLVDAFGWFGAEKRAMGPCDEFLPADCGLDVPIGMHGIEEQVDTSGAPGSYLQRGLAAGRWDGGRSG